MSTARKSGRTRQMLEEAVRAPAQTIFVVMSSYTMIRYAREMLRDLGLIPDDLVIAPEVGLPWQRHLRFLAAPNLSEYFLRGYRDVEVFVDHSVDRAACPALLDVPVRGNLQENEHES